MTNPSDRLAARRACKHVCWVLVILAGVWVVYTAWQGPWALKRSFPGRVVRFAFGSPLAAQDVDDLVDELSVPAKATALRLWAEDVLKAQRHRVIRAEAVPNWGIDAVSAPDIAPAPVLANHHAMLGSTPETYLCIDVEGRVVAVVLSWANLRVGVVVRPGGEAPSLERLYERQPSPDIRVFAGAS